jgi:hypothetical protein
MSRCESAPYILLTFSRSDPPRTVALFIQVTLIGDDICTVIRSWSKVVNESGQIDRGDGAGSTGLRRRDDVVRQFERRADAIAKRSAGGKDDEAVPPAPSQTSAAQAPGAT